MASTAEKPSVAVAMVASTAVKPGKPSVGVAAALGRILAFASTAGQPSVASVAFAVDNADTSSPLADRTGRCANNAGTTAVPLPHFLASLQGCEEQDEIHLQNPCGNQLER